MGMKVQGIFSPWDDFLPDFNQWGFGPTGSVARGNRFSLILLLMLVQVLVKEYGSPD